MSVYKNAERRLLSSKINLRTGASGQPQMFGYAAKYNTLSQDLGGFRETLAPGCFNRAIREGQDCRALFNHDPNMILGRTKSGTLRLSADATGLYFVCDLPDTSTGRDVHTMIQRGDVSQCSFSFQVIEPNGQKWDEATDESGASFTRRTILDLNLFDISSVVFPAYSDTNVDADTLPLADISALTHPSNASQFNSIPKSVLVEARSFAQRHGIKPRPPVVRMTDAEILEAVHEDSVERWLATPFSGFPWQRKSQGKGNHR